jgi:hemoglobin/transferrin/lactoferrin receptor protein
MTMTFSSPLRLDDRCRCFPALILLLATILAWAPAAAAEDAGAEATATKNELANELSDDSPSGEPQPEEDLSFFASTSVTATGSETDTFDIPTPVIVIDAERIQELQPDNAADLLRYEPGVDVNGIGPNQPRPIIRGQRGLRVLFLENGLRMNNARRQTDFGEITGLVDVNNVETVEVVRGPASVLYGSDAIGGVLNLITKVPSGGTGRNTGVSLGLRHGSAGGSTAGSASFFGHSDRFSFSAGGTYRDGENYDSAAGSFGAIRLEQELEVDATALRDDHANLYLGWRATDRNTVFFRVNRYRAGKAGFGFVDPEAIGDDSGALIRILYPFQDFDRYTLGYEGSGLQSALATTVGFQLYQQSNQRELVNDIFINIGPAFGPGRGPDGDVSADTLNFTDLDTTGFRGEVTKIAGGGDHLVTYGGEYYQDDSFNTDSSVTTTALRAFFPIAFVCGPEGATPVFGAAGPFFQCTFVDTDSVANSPNATNSGYGVFLQDEMRLVDRLSLTLGLRYSKTETNAEATPGWDVTGLDFDDDAVVGAVNLTYSLTPSLNLIASYGTAFRAPNIIERLFNGLTPEGLGFQVLNLNLASEESDNVDLGLKFRTSNAYLEAFYFDTEIDDAIIQHDLSDAEIAQLPADVQATIQQSDVDFVVQQRNADVFTVEGVEVAGGYRFDNGLSLGANYTHLSGRAESGPNDPTGDTFSDKWNAHLRYEPADRRYWLEYQVRHNGDEDLDVANLGGPLGDVLPSFTVHRVAGGTILGDRGNQEHRIGFIIDNLTDELYAEFSNATFFRPQPGRNFIATYNLRIK